MIEKWPAFKGTCRYEFRMQIRRPALWITIAAIFLVLVRFEQAHLENILFIAHSSLYPTALQREAAWADSINHLLPIVVGVLLADRLGRDRRTGVAELLEATPAPFFGRLIGKYLGSTFATLIPVFMFYMLGTLVLLIRIHDVLVLPYALLTFVTIVLPGMMFVAAFSLCCGAFMWWPIYCFLLTGYWFWGNQLSPRNHIWTISESILTPAGGYMSKGFFGVPAFQIYDVAITPIQSVVCILLLLSITLCVLLVTWKMPSLKRWK